MTVEGSGTHKYPANGVKFNRRNDCQIMLKIKKFAVKSGRNQPKIRSKCVASF